MTARTSTGVALRRRARALARIHAGELLAALRADDDAAVLGALAGADRGLAVAVGAYVAGLRDEAVPWSTVGELLGVTRQAAAQRFGAGLASYDEAMAATSGAVAELLADTGYDDAPGRAHIVAGHAGHLAGYCYRRQHARCPGHALGRPCACTCHAPA